MSVEVNDRKEAQRNFNETLGSFIEHRVENQKNRLKMHEEYLRKVVEDRVLLKDRELPFKHKDMTEEMKDFRIAGGGLKNDLYNKIEQLRSFG